MSGKKRHVSTYTAVVLVAAITLTGAYATHESAADLTFKEVDVNRNGYVSREEAKKFKGLDKTFSEADDNRDGKLDADEFVKAQSIYERMRAERFIDDSLITARIKVGLVKDPQVSALDVKVETHEGTVLLSGIVGDAKQARRAAEIASRIRGVTAVKNGLVVKNGPERRADGESRP